MTNSSPQAEALIAAAEALIEHIRQHADLSHGPPITFLVALQQGYRPSELA